MAGMLISAMKASYGVVVMVACHCKLAMEGDGLAHCE
jgi:hypothetical protein